MGRIFLPSHQLLSSEPFTLTTSLYLGLASVCMEGRDVIAHFSGSLRRGMGHPAGSWQIALTLLRTPPASSWPAKGVLVRPPSLSDSDQMGTFGLLMGNLLDCVTHRNRENIACIVLFLGSWNTAPICVVRSCTERPCVCWCAAWVCQGCCRLPRSEHSPDCASLSAALSLCL